VRPALIVKSKVDGQVLLGLGHGVIGMQVHFLVIDALPQALDEEVVAPGASTVHAEGDTAVLHGPDEGRAGELAPLVGVQDPGAAVVPDRGL